MIITTTLQANWDADWENAPPQKVKKVFFVDLLEATQERCIATQTGTNGVGEIVYDVEPINILSTNGVGVYTSDIVPDLTKYFAGSLPTGAGLEADTQFIFDFMNYEVASGILGAVDSKIDELKDVYWMSLNDIETYFNSSIYSTNATHRTFNFPTSATNTVFGYFPSDHVSVIDASATHNATSSANQYNWVYDMAVAPTNTSQIIACSGDWVQLAVPILPTTGKAFNNMISLFNYATLGDNLIAYPEFEAVSFSITNEVVTGYVAGSNAVHAVTNYIQNIGEQVFYDYTELITTKDRADTVTNNFMMARYASTGVETFDRSIDGLRLDSTYFKIVPCASPSFSGSVDIIGKIQAEIVDFDLTDFNFANPQGVRNGEAYKPYTNTVTVTTNKTLDVTFAEIDSIDTSSLFVDSCFSLEIYGVYIGDDFNELDDAETYLSKQGLVERRELLRAFKTTSIEVRNARIGLYEQAKSTISLVTSNVYEITYNSYDGAPFGGSTNISSGVTTNVDTNADIALATNTIWTTSSVQRLEGVFTNLTTSGNTNISDKSYTFSQDYFYDDPPAWQATDGYETIKTNSLVYSSISTNVQMYGERYKVLFSELNLTTNTAGTIALFEGDYLEVDKVHTTYDNNLRITTANAIAHCTGAQINTNVTFLENDIRQAFRTIDLDYVGTNKTFVADVDVCLPLALDSSVVTTNYLPLIVYTNNALTTIRTDYSKGLGASNVVDSAEFDFIINEASANSAGFNSFHTNSYIVSTWDCVDIFLSDNDPPQFGDGKFDAEGDEEYIRTYSIQDFKFSLETSRRYAIYVEWNFEYD